MKIWEQKAKIICLLLSLISINGWSNYSGADYEVDENGVIYSRTLDIEGELRKCDLEERVSRRKTIAERMADKRKRMEKRKRT